MRRVPSNVLVFAGLAVLILLVAVFLPSSPRSRSDGKLRIVCTFLPNYVFTQNVVGDTPDIEIRLLVSPETGCPHGYVLSPADLKAIAQANIIVANGLGLELFLDDLRHANPKARVIEISATCDVLETAGPHHHDHDEAGPATSSPDHEAGPRSEPSQDDHEQDATKDEAAHTEPHHGDEHAVETANPHVWVSPVQAIRQIRELARQLAEVDPAHAAQFQANANAFVARIENLHRRMRETASQFANRRIVTFHDAFAYLARDLDLEIVATLAVEPSAPPSAQDLARIIDTIRRTGAAAVFYEPAYSDTVARTVSRDAGVPFYALNPFNSLDAAPSSRSYEEVMERNLDTLRKALGPKP